MLKTMKLIYNPFSGDKNFKNKLDACLLKFQSVGYDVHIFRSIEHNDIEAHLKEASKRYKYDAFVISGGDGTINILMNAVMKLGLNDAPIGIIPSGTANDFASFLKLPKNIDECCDIICNGKTQAVDIGLANDKYFINVCAGGLFSNVSMDVDKDIKDVLGKFAYYIKGLEQIPGFTPMKMRITNSTASFEDEIILFLVLNSSGTGGIENLSPGASISDGLFDFVAFKGVSFGSITSLVLKFFKGDYLNDKRIIFFKDNYIKIENLSSDQRFIQTDLDGECGPEMPVTIKNIHYAVNIFN